MHNIDQVITKLWIHKTQFTLQKGPKLFCFPLPKGKFQFFNTIHFVTCRSGSKECKHPLLFTCKNWERTSEISGYGHPAGGVTKYR